MLTRERYMNYETSLSHLLHGWEAAECVEALVRCSNIMNSHNHWVTLPHDETALRKCSLFLFLNDVDVSPGYMLDSLLALSELKPLWDPQCLTPQDHQNPEYIWFRTFYLSLILTILLLTCFKSSMFCIVVSLTTVLTVCVSNIFESVCLLAEWRKF